MVNLSYSGQLKPAIVLVDRGKSGLHGIVKSFMLADTSGYPHLQITDQHAEKQNKSDIVIIHKGLKTRIAFAIGHQPLLIDK